MIIAIFAIPQFAAWVSTSLIYFPRKKTKAGNNYLVNYFGDDIFERIIVLKAHTLIM